MSCPFLSPVPAPSPPSSSPSSSSPLKQLTMKTSLTKKPMVPMTTKPRAVLVTILLYSERERREEREGEKGVETRARKKNSAGACVGVRASAGRGSVAPSRPLTQSWPRMMPSCQARGPLAQPLYTRAPWASTRDHWKSDRPPPSLPSLQHTFRVRLVAPLHQADGVLGEGLQLCDVVGHGGVKGGRVVWREREARARRRKEQRSASRGGALSPF